MAEKKENVTRDEFYQTIKEFIDYILNWEDGKTALAMDLISNDYYQTLFSNTDLEKIWEDSMDVCDDIDDITGEISYSICLDVNLLFDNYLERLYEKRKKSNNGCCR